MGMFIAVYVGLMLIFGIFCLAIFFIVLHLFLNFIYYKWPNPYLKKIIDWLEKENDQKRYKSFTHKTLKDLSNLDNNRRRR